MFMYVDYLDSNCQSYKHNWLGFNLLDKCLKITPLHELHSMMFNSKEKKQSSAEYKNLNEYNHLKIFSI